MTDEPSAEQERLAGLERRVAALEAATTEPPAETSARRTPDPETFWALAGLRSRIPAPGGVLLTGSVTLPGDRTAEWQEGALTADLLEGDWAETAGALAALGHPVRLRLLQQVLAGSETAQDLLETEGVGTSGQVYHHLRQLTAAGWLRGIGGGRHEVPVARIIPLLAVVLGGRR